MQSSVSAGDVGVVDAFLRSLQHVPVRTCVRDGGSRAWRGGGGVGSVAFGPVFLIFPLDEPGGPLYANESFGAGSTSSYIAGHSI